MRCRCASMQTCPVAASQPGTSTATCRSMLRTQGTFPPATLSRWVAAHQHMPLSTLHPVSNPSRSLPHLLCLEYVAQTCQQASAAMRAAITQTPGTQQAPDRLGHMAQVLGPSQRSAQQAASLRSGQPVSLRA